MMEIEFTDPDDTATTTTTGYDSFEPCGDGVLCMKTPTDTTGYEWLDSSTMAESAIMTWIYRGSSAAVSDVIYSTSVTNTFHRRTRHVRRDVEISSDDALSTGSWHHVFRWFQTIFMV